MQNGSNKFFGISEKYLLIFFFISIFIFKLPPPQYPFLYVKIQFIQAYSDGVYFRSLVGSIYSFLVNKYDIPHLYASFTFILISTFTLLYFFLQKVVIKKNGMYSKEFLLYALVMLSPVGVLFFFNVGQFYRLDTVLVFLYLISILSIVYNDKYLLVSYFFITIIAILTHESYLFIFVPVLFLIILSEIIRNNKSKYYVASFICVNLSFVMLFLYIKSFRHINTEDVLLSINNRTNLEDYNEAISNNVFPHLKLIYESTISDNINHSLNSLFTANGIITIVTNVLTQIPLVLIIYKSLKNKNVVNVLLSIIPLLIAVAMCFIGTDLVRWFSMTSLSYLGIITYLMKNEEIFIKHSSFEMITLLVFYLSLGRYKAWYLGVYFLDYLEIIQKNNYY